MTVRARDLRQTLRAPATAILACAEDLAYWLQDDPRGLGELLVLRHHGEHLLGLITGAGTHDPDTATDVRSLTRDLMLHLEGSARRRRLAWDLVIDPDTPPVSSLPDHSLCRILIPFLANALATTATGGVQVALHAWSTSTGAPGAQWVIKDSGSGLAPHVVSAMAAPSLGRETGRLGTLTSGLWVARQTVQQLGGSLEIRSRMGGGSTVCLALPACRDPGRHPPRAREGPINVEAGQDAPGLAHRRLLLGSGDRTATLWAASRLLASGAVVVWAVDQTDLQRRLRPHPDATRSFDAIILAQGFLAGKDHGITALRGLGFPGPVVLIAGPSHRAPWMPGAPVAETDGVTWSQPGEDLQQQVLVAIQRHPQTGPS